MSVARGGGLRGRDLALVLVICLAWSGNFLTSAFALREIPPFLFTAVRLAILALALFAFVKRPPEGQWPRLIAVALCNGVLHFGLSFWALHLAGDLASPAIAMQSYVPMAALLAWWWLGEHFGWRTGMAIAISFAGVLVLGFDPIVLDAPISMVLMLVSAAFLAIGTVMMRRLSGLGMGMLAIFVAMSALTWWVQANFGTRTLLMLAIAVFVIAWIAQFIGHKIEGRKPSFLTDLTYLLIGPAWVLAKGLRKLGIAW